MLCDGYWSYSTLGQLGTCFCEHAFCLFNEPSYPSEHVHVQVILVFKNIWELLCCRLCLSSTRSDDFNSNPLSALLPVYFPTSHTEKLLWLHCPDYTGIVLFHCFCHEEAGRKGRVKTNGSSCGFNLHFPDY